MHRLFVGLRPPPAIRTQLRALMQDPATPVPGARWQDDEQFHITLRFIGEVDRRTAEDVALALERLHAEPVAVALAGVGRFEKKGRTDAIWAGLAPHDALAALHRKVDRALSQIGLPPEGRAYLPHITLARMPRGLGQSIGIDRFLAGHASLASEPFALDHLILFESHLTREAARYESVGRWRLG